MSIADWLFLAIGGGGIVVWLLWLVASQGVG